MRVLRAVLTFLRLHSGILFACRRVGRQGDELVGTSVASDWLFELVKPHLGDRVAEFGVGGGMMMQRVARHSRVVVVAALPNVVAELRTRSGNRPNVEVYEGDATDAHVWEIIRDGGMLDSAVSFDYLEHVENDVAVMRNVHDTLRPGGRMVIFTVASRGSTAPWTLPRGIFAASGAVSLSARRAGRGFG